MQYYQLQYMIKILLLNGLFVLFSHAMDMVDVGCNNFMKNLLQPTNINLEDNSYLMDTEYYYIPSRFCSSTYSYEEKNTKERKINQKKKKLRRKKRSLLAKKSRYRLNSAIDEVIKEAGVDGKRLVGLNNAKMKIRELKRKCDSLEANNTWQKKWRVKLLRNYHELTDDREETMKAANKILDGEYQAALYELFERDKTIETMKKELKKSSVTHSELYKYISSLEKKTVPLEVALAKSQIENDELQKQNSKLQELFENDCFSCSFKRQNYLLFPIKNLENRS